MDTVYTRYTVAPFSQVQTGAREVRSDQSTCAICGKVVREPAKHLAIVVDGGATWGDENSDANAPGYMGEFAVGAECHKRFAMRERAAIESARQR